MHDGAVLQSSTPMNRTSVLALVAEFGPIIAFFIAGRLTDFFTAVAILMLTTATAVLVSWHVDRRIPWLPILSAFFVLLGGLITLLYRAPDAIILADTMYYLTIVLGLGITLARRQLLLKQLFGTVFAITDRGWQLLTWRWFWFLLAAAIANEIARALLTPESWIDYRFYKTILVTLFALFQFILSSQYRLPDVSNRFGLRVAPSPMPIQK